MSKNYTNYNKPNSANKQKEEQKVTPITPDVNENEQTIAPATLEVNENKQTSTPDPKPEATEPIIGVVANCKMLNVRAEPDKNAEILTIINAGEEVEIIEDGSTDEFYHIVYGKNKRVSVEGFCMKDFITIK